jgi:UDP-3-O-[3-hydroxymyristoyl] glucosamine N-acyltransferase
MALVDATATVANSATIEPFAIVGANVVIGERALVRSHVTIEQGAIVGDDSTIEYGAVLHEGTEVGRRSTIGSNTVVGRQGFGFTTGPAGPVRLTHVGKTIVGDDTHIGALCTLDRARFDVTRVGNMTALDNHFHSGHNSIVGDRCFFAAQCGLAGHATIEDDVIAGGHVGVNNVVVGARSQIGAKTSVMRAFGPDSKILGVPARDMGDTMRMEATLRKLALTKKRRKPGQST